MKMSNYIAAGLIIVLISAVISIVIARHYASLAVSQQERIVVLDLRTLAKSIDPQDPEAQIKLETLIQKARIKAREYWEAGYVVLNETAILEAPDDIFIRMD